MASSQQQLSSFIERLIDSRNRDISLVLPFLLGLNATSPLQETENQESPDRIILINPITQGMVVIERRDRNSDTSASVDFNSFLSDFFTAKGGPPPASKASIDSMATVEMVGGEMDGEQCVICLEEWEHGHKAKEMPCRHRFHGECIEKWLRIHGSCPVCRYEMPVEEYGDGKRRSGEGEGERRRAIWMSFVFSGERRNGGGDQESSGADDFEESHQEVQG